MKSFSLILFFLCVSSCTLVKPKSWVDSNDFTVTLSRWGYTVTVSPDGNVLFQGYKQVRVLGDSKSSISLEKYREIVKVVRDAHIEQLKNQYITQKDGCGEMTITDSSLMTIKVAADSKAKEVTFSNGCTWGSVKDETQRIDRLGQQIDSILDTHQWIGSPAS
ncbi:hypothetical protein ELE36_12450 [Pseudolysobacter antarcticus]|uniref:DUF6438 domain-containing protein n=1 Tax=Pseudolysobacter antarcticus TaxID=2511995 RepID=A0A411HL42_9GAMM|nr:DUF6438 domain-containing protein [Pseudolysobacter antarcticus]QBB71097.1 hypothetical protein ELE36_12450 [Pseudolysobacter antarcticus]